MILVRLFLCLAITFTSLDGYAGEAPTVISEVRASVKKIIKCPNCPEDPPRCSLESNTGLEVSAEVRVEGVVSAASGKFAKSYDNAGFQLDDGTGGIFIMTPTNLGLERGARVHAIGKLRCRSGTLALADTTVTALDADSAADPNLTVEDLVVFAPRQVGQLSKEPGDIEGVTGVTRNWCDCLNPVSYTEGELITVRGMTVADVVRDGNYGYKLFLDDGTGVAQIFIDAASGIPVERIQNRLLNKGSDLCVTGIVAEFAGVGYELLPRTPDDIRHARTYRNNPCAH